MNNPSDDPQSLRPGHPVASWRPTSIELAVGGLATFVSGFFVMAVAGQDLPLLSLLLVLGGGFALSLPIGVIAVSVAMTEGLIGRAWATGFRRLAPEERPWRASLTRGGRYGGFLWLANGAALWFAALSTAF